MAIGTPDLVGLCLYRGRYSGCLRLFVALADKENMMLSWSDLYKLLKIKNAIEQGNITGIIEMKPWYTSKTIIANIIAILTAIGAGLTGEVTWAADLPIIMTAILNLGLRFVTSTAIGDPSAGQSK